MNKKDLDVISERALEVGFTREQFEKEVSFALQIWNDPKNLYLRKATKNSMLSAVLNVAQVGLTLNPIAKEAYLVPRKQGNDIVACLDPSYIGLAKLITDAGSVNNIITQVVYDGDLFELDLALENPIIKHVPYILTKKPKGDVVLVYSKAILHNGNIMVEFMSADEINYIRDKSESYKAFKNGKTRSAIWDSDYSEMCRKTVIKRLSKYLPRTNRMNYLDTAIKLSNIEYEATGTQIGMIESLLKTSSILESQKDSIERNLNGLNHHEAEKTISYLKDNQVNAIQAGNNYGKRDIDKMLDDKISDERQ